MKDDNTDLVLLIMGLAGIAISITAMYMGA